MEKRLIFEENGRNHRILEDRDLVNIIETALGQKIKPEGHHWRRDYSIHKRTAQERNHMSISLPVYSSMHHHAAYKTNGEIRPIDEPKFIAEALEIAQRHSLIDSMVYETVYELRLDGEYLLLHNGNPLIKVIGTPQNESDWAYKPTRVESYDGENVFSHKPLLPEPKVELSLSTDNTEFRKVIDDIFRNALQHYKAAGYTLVNETEPVEAA
tara:strand:- start:66 stop:701 length:636 start_codon:yes stop_codon:yes gene_type:complete